MRQRSTLQQWAVLAAIRKYGGFAAAAKALHSSQSAVSYTVAQLQSVLGLRLLEMEGRRAVLTENGKSLLSEAQLLLEGLDALEERSRLLAGGKETSLTLAVSTVFPDEVLFSAFAEFRSKHRYVQLTPHSVTRLTAEEGLNKLKAQICILTHSPERYLSDHLLDVSLLAVARKDHPLCSGSRVLSRQDLSKHLLISVVEEGAQPREPESPITGGERWNVTTPGAALSAIRSGCGYGWLQDDQVTPYLATGELHALRLRTGAKRIIPVYLLRDENVHLGPTALDMVEILSRRSRAWAVSKGPLP